MEIISGLRCVCVWVCKYECVSALQEWFTWLRCVGVGVGMSV